MKFYKSGPTEDDRDSCVQFIIIKNFNTCYSYIWDIVIAYNIAHQQLVHEKLLLFNNI